MTTSLAACERAAAGSPAVAGRHVLEGREEAGVESFVRHDRQGVASTFISWMLPFVAPARLMLVCRISSSPAARLCDSHRP